ncbi:MAG: DNA topoisomerase IV subunit B, partial [Candidatus Lokiarchaeota archaeon]|nr:DNA topoisomerase IV subunit B [Candidatus Lokiarchaeota archaeon]
MDVIIKDDEYDAEDIKVLKGLEGVRKRPSMYIGSTHKEGWHHLIWEVVDNSIDEALAGFCSKINIKINNDDSITIEDDGRGIPTGIHKDYNKPTLEVIITHLHAGGKFDKGSYKISGGLHGVGISVVAACAEWMFVEIFRDNKYYCQKFGKGLKLTELKSIPIEEYQKQNGLTCTATEKSQENSKQETKKNKDTENGNENENENENESDVEFSFQ